MSTIISQNISSGTIHDIKYIAPWMMLWYNIVSYIILSDTYIVSWIIYYFLYQNDAWYMISCMLYDIFQNSLWSTTTKRRHTATSRSSSVLASVSMSSGREASCNCSPPFHQNSWWIAISMINLPNYRQPCVATQPIMFYLCLFIYFYFFFIHRSFSETTRPIHPKFLGIVYSSVD